MNNDIVSLLKKEFGESLNSDTLLDFFITVLDALPNVSFVKDSQGKYIYVNKAFENYMNKSRLDIIGKTDFDIMPEQEAKECINSDQPARNTPAKIHTSFEVKYNSIGAIESYLSVNKHLVDSELGSVLIGVVTEVHA